MKWQRMSDWLQGSHNTKNPLWGFGIYIGGTMPEGFHINLHFWKWSYHFSCVVGKWE